MASIHNELRRGPWSAAANAILGETREGAGIERMGESLTPVFDLWNPARPDWSIYRREQEIYLHAATGAVAAELAAVIFEPPSASIPKQDSVLVVHELHITCAVAAQFNIGYDIRPAGSAEATTKDFFDVRSRPTQAARPRSKVYTDTNAATALTGPFLRVTVLANVTTVFRRRDVMVSNPSPLTNNLVLIVECQTVNQAFSATAIGRERQLLLAEVRATS